MALWKIEPVTDADRSRWLDHPIWVEVVVRAPSAALARLLAAEMERDAMIDHASAGNESHSFSSGFDDEKLYRVRPLDPRDEPGLEPAGADAVLRAFQARDPALR